MQIATAIMISVTASGVGTASWRTMKRSENSATSTTATIAQSAASPSGMCAA